MSLEPHRSEPSLGLTLARAGAVVLALSVLAWFVYDAEGRASRRAEDAARAAAAAAAAAQAAEQESEAVGLELPAALSSSKSLVIEPSGEFLSGSKSTVIVDPPVPARRTRRTVIQAHSSSKSIVLSEPLLLPEPEPPVEKAANGQGVEKKTETKTGAKTDKQD